MAEKIVFTERLTTFYKYPSVCLYQDEIENPGDFLSYLKIPSTQRRQQMIYIHIPFCTSMCLYCPFYKVNYRHQAQETIDRVVDCLALELKKYASEPFFQEVPIVNVHIGGGSPMILELHHFEKLLATIHDGFNTETCEVISIEGDPLTMQNSDKLKTLKEMGMTRCSFGMQTFNERLRKKLGIESSIRDVYKAVDAIKKCDIQEFACDVLYNLPDQNANEIRYNIDRVCEMEPDGVDFYDLNLLPNTKLQKRIDQGYFKTKPSNKNEIEQFKAGLETFQDNNYQQVRSVVFKPAGNLDVHPKGVLNRYHSDILAIGPSARTSLYSGGANYRNHCSLERYVHSLENGQYPIEAGNIMSEEVMEERDMILFPYYLKIPKKNINYQRFKDKIENMKESGYIQETDQYLELTDLGRLWPGNVQYYFHSELEKERIANTTFSCMLEGKSIFNQDDMNCGEE